MASLLEMSIHFVLLVATSAAHHISCTPPRIAQESSNHLLRAQDERKDKASSGPGKEALHGHRRLNRLAMMAIVGTKYVVWSVAALELTARLLSLFPSSSLSCAILPILLPTPSPKVSILPVPGLSRQQTLLLTAPSPVFLFSVLSISIGFAIRRACFAAMGRHFSFTHTTLAGHQLIKSGPYGIVRHPSYTGELLVRGGMVAFLLAPGGFVRACGALHQHPSGFIAGLDLPQQILLASVRTGVAFYIGWVVFACTYLILRAPLEDATLRETFGEEWDAYSKDVPFRFVPHVA